MSFARPLVLFVEDCDDARELFAECLERCGFDVRTARDGLEALALASALPRPDVVLMDLGLPRIDGFEATRRLQADARTRDIPVVALTGQCEDRVLDSAAGAEFRAVLEKPCLPDVAAEVLRRLADRGLCATA